VSCRYTSAPSSAALPLSPSVVVTRSVVAAMKVMVNESCSPFVSMVPLTRRS
jgi:hypothetical protein